MSDVTRRLGYLGRYPATRNGSMTESEMQTLVQQQLRGFVDPQAIAAVQNWELLVESVPNAWLLYRVDDDIGIAYSLAESWADTPWAVVDGFSVGGPSTRTYCPGLEDAVRDVVYNGEIPPGEAGLAAREAAMERARNKRKNRGK